MSQVNVDTVLTLYAGWNAGDMEAVRKQLDPRIVVWNPPDFPEPGPFIGPEGVMRQWVQQRETYQADALEPITEPIHAADRVVIRFIWHGMGQGPQANIEVTGVYAVRRGRVATVEHFWSHAEALEAAGLAQQPMSRENVEIVRAAYRAYIAGDREAYLDFFAEEVEACPDASRFTEAKPFRGREEFRRFLAESDEDWEGGASSGEIREVFPVGNDRVVTLADWGGRGRTSGIDVRSSLTSILTIRDGRIVKIEWFFDHAKALEAVGLSE